MLWLLRLMHIKDLNKRTVKTDGRNPFPSWEPPKKWYERTFSKGLSLLPVIKVSPTSRSVPKLLESLCDGNFQTFTTTCVYLSPNCSAVGSPYLASEGKSFPKDQIIDPVGLKNLGLFSYCCCFVLFLVACIKALLVFVLFCFFASFLIWLFSSGNFLIVRGSTK